MQIHLSPGKQIVLETYFGTGPNQDLCIMSALQRWSEGVAEGPIILH
jgi:hypothetical protein